MSPGEIGHDGEVDGQDGLVRDGGCDVAAFSQEAELLAEGDLADDIEGQVVEPVVPVDRGVGRREGRQAAAEEVQQGVDVGFRLDDVGQRVAGGEVLLLLDVPFGVAFGHLIGEARVGDGHDVVPGALCRVDCQHLIYLIY